jgi:hypothetical protein
MRIQGGDVYVPPPIFLGALNTIPYSILGPRM